MLSQLLSIIQTGDEIPDSQRLIQRDAVTGKLPAQTIGGSQSGQASGAQPLAPSGHDPSSSRHRSPDWITIQIYGTRPGRFSLLKMQGLFDT